MNLRDFFRKYPFLSVYTVVSLTMLIALAVTGATLGWDNYFKIVHARAALPLDIRGFLGAPWTLVTHPFVSVPPAALFFLFGLVLLWSFGLMLSGTIGERKFRALMLVSLFVLPVILFGICAPLPFIGAEDMLYGPELGSWALVAATITLLPGMKVRVFFFIEVKLIWLGLIILFGSWVMGIVSLSHYMFSVPLGAGFGWLYVTQQRKGRDLAGWIYLPWEWKDRKRERSKSKAREQQLKKAYQTFQVVPKEQVAQMDDPESEVNRILDKITAQGYDKLTRAEKEFLDRHSRQ